MSDQQAGRRPLRFKLDPDRSLVLLIDVQERLAAAMDPAAFARVEQAAVTLIEGAKLLGVPVMATEQYPRGLGATRQTLREVLPGAPLEKSDFSCWAAAPVREAIEATGRTQIVISGMETHVCVYQTARDLAMAGHEPFVVSEAVLSRTPENRRLGLSLISAAGGVVTGVETVLFDWMGTANHPKFKDVSKLVK